MHYLKLKKICNLSNLLMIYLLIISMENIRRIYNLIVDFLKFISNKNILSKVVP